MFHEHELEQKIEAPFPDFFEKYLHHNKVLWDRYQKGFISTDELKWKRMWRTMLEFKNGDEQLARSMSKVFLDILPTKQHLFPHTKELLQYLKDKGYEMHIITNGFEKTQWSKIRNSGLDQFFSHVITSEGSNSIKPEKEIFEFARTKSGALHEHSIMIGDNQDADIQGGINAGMDTVFVNHILEEQRVPSTYTVKHLQELESIL